MAVDEYSHHALYQRLDEVLGPEDATRLMERLPQVPWVEMASKHDLKENLNALAERFDDRLARVAAELKADFRGEMTKLSHTLFFSMAGLTLTGMSLAFAAARFGG